VLNGNSGKRTAQHRLALFRTPPCHIRAPAQQNLTQIPDRHVDGSYEIDLTPGTIVNAIIAQTQYFGAHALPPNQSDGSMAAIG
jgi:hypothetical protein